jgi:hypothetical protein
MVDGSAALRTSMIVVACRDMPNIACRLPVDERRLEKQSSGNHAADRRYRTPGAAFKL